MSKKIKISITSWLNDSVLFEYESVDNTFKKTVERAVGHHAYLSYAYLRYADLLSAKNLSKYYIHDLDLLLSQKNRLTAYKYLTQDMRSPIQVTKITYVTGKTYKEEVDTNRKEDCGVGLNIATLGWCLRETQGNLKDFKYIEVSFDPKDLVIPYFTDGKFRVSELKVERKLTLKELKKACEAINV